MSLHYFRAIKDNKFILIVNQKILIVDLWIMFGPLDNFLWLIKIKAWLKTCNLFPSNGMGGGGGGGGRDDNNFKLEEASVLK